VCVEATCNLPHAVMPHIHPCRYNHMLTGSACCAPVCSEPVHYVCSVLPGLLQPACQHTSERQWSEQL
jgi:hypothetical protein